MLAKSFVSALLIVSASAAAVAGTPTKRAVQTAWGTVSSDAVVQDGPDPLSASQDTIASTIAPAMLSAFPIHVRPRFMNKYIEIPITMTGNLLTKEVSVLNVAVNTSTPLELRICVDQPKNISPVEQIIIEAGCPESPYKNETSSGKAKDRIDIKKKASPQDFGIINKNGCIAVKSAVRMAELNNKSYRQSWSDGGEPMHTLSYRVLISLQSSLDLIQPTNKFPYMSKRGDSVVKAYAFPHASRIRGRAISPAADKTITLSCIAQLYDYAGGSSIPSSANKIGVVGFVLHVAQTKGLKQFLNRCTSSKAKGSPRYATGKSDGTQDLNPNARIDKASFDIKYTRGINIANSYQSMFYPLGQVTDVRWLKAMIKEKHSGRALRISIGKKEQHQQESDKLTKAKKLYNLSMHLGLRGISAKGYIGSCRISFKPDAHASHRPSISNLYENSDTVPETITYASFPNPLESFGGPNYKKSVVDESLEDSKDRKFQAGESAAAGMASTDSTRTASLRFIKKGRRGEGISVPAPILTSAVTMLNDKRAKDGKLPVGLMPVGILSPRLQTDSAEDALRDISAGKSLGGKKTGSGFSWRVWDSNTRMGTAGLKIPV
ncbi:hypothetical protein H072_9712 [Dactylellina haptotyla CBS 200.50]|uniref:Peptidase S53 domain-containing protein n=1 Tax=Dactylellina haptotyla (strain CBS 200.50) TaxID=1284197 RepID=S8A6I6_DACHA|nr:hypothetical protein H072_9712 [Dactylellina haptotyla CBS 200.50]